jgi:hypothetical protein
MRTNLPEPWLSIKNYYGTLDKMAQTLGVSRQTFRQWIIGTRQPYKAARMLLNLFLEAHGYPAQEWPPVRIIRKGNQNDNPVGRKLERYKVP